MNNQTARKLKQTQMRFINDLIKNMNFWRRFKFVYFGDYYHALTDTMNDMKGNDKSKGIRQKTFGRGIAKIDRENGKAVATVTDYREKTFKKKFKTIEKAVKWCNRKKYTAMVKPEPDKKPKITKIPDKVEPEGKTDE
jgi:hypothetical protein